MRMPDSVTGSIQLDNQRLLAQWLRFPVKELADNIPVKELADKFVFTPNKEGVHTAIFTAEAPGYSPAMTEFVLTARKMVALDVKAVGNDGTKLDVNIESADNSLHKGLQTPQILEVKPGKIDLSFSSEHTFNDHNYVLTDVIVNGQKINHVNGSVNIVVNIDSDFIAQYEKSVHVNVLGAKGSGIYPYGDKVVLSAPTYNIYSFLIREVFDFFIIMNVLGAKGSGIYPYGDKLSAPTYNIYSFLIERFLTLMLIIHQRFLL